MNTDRYRFKLGNFECLAILDWTASRDAAFYFPNVSHALLKAENIVPDSVNSPGICLAINTGIDWVLLDTGLGFAWEDGSHLAQILEEENIQPRHIIITHLDLDHYGGLINSDKTLVFPNAEVYICRDAWVDFTSASFYKKADRGYDRREHLLLIEEQVTTVDCDGEVLPGFTLIPFPGHREHHVGIEVESKGEKLLFAAKRQGSSCKVTWHCGADSYHDIARESRIKLAQMASESACLVLAYHFDFPGLGRITQNGDDWKWQPIEL